MNAANSIKMRLLSLGKKQTDLFDELENRGVQIGNFSQLNAYINGRMITGEKAQFVLTNINRVLSDWESEMQNAHQPKPRTALNKIPDINHLESSE
jgi:hypothetical protein